MMTKERGRKPRQEHCVGENVRADDEGIAFVVGQVDFICLICIANLEHLKSLLLVLSLGVQLH